MAFDDDDLEEIIGNLRGFAVAYPTEIFPEISHDERARLHLDYPGFQDRVAASMGRHLAPFFRQAADALEQLRNERNARDVKAH